MSAPASPQATGRKLVGQLLIAHNIQIRLRGGRLEALEVIIGPNREDCSRWIDVSDFGPREILDWLGY